MSYFDQSKILDLHAAALQAGLQNQRSTLLGFLPADFVATLPVKGDLSAQLLSDLQALNGAVPLAGGMVPLVSWLQVASGRAQALNRHAAFAQALRELTQAGPPGHAAGGAGGADVHAHRRAQAPLRAEAQVENQVIDLLVAAYPRRNAIETLLQRIGVPASAVDLDGETKHVWPRVWTAVAAHQRTEALWDQVLSDSSIARYHAELGRLRRGEPAPRAAGGAPRIDVGILTIKEEEFVAVLDRFSPDPALERRGQRRDYEVARIETPRGPCHVAVTRSILQGTGPAQAVATEMLDDLAPACVIVVGIAGGLPTSDFTLGDVIVSSFVHDLTLEDTGTGTPRFNATGGPLHSEAERVVARLPAFARAMGVWASGLTAARPPYDGAHTTNNEPWNRSIDEAFAHHRASGRVAPIARAERLASSDRLVKDPELVAVWRTVLRGIAAVEMETAGVYTVCQRRNVPCFAVRGISDIVGWRRDERWTLYACDTAATYARALVGTGALVRGSA